MVDSLKPEGSRRALVAALLSGASVAALTPRKSEASYLFADHIPYVPPGTGSVQRNVGAKITETPSSTDFGTGTQAVAQVQALGGGVLHVPGGAAPTLPATYYNVTIDYDGPLTPSSLISNAATMYGKKLYRSQDSGSHANQQHHAVLIEANPVGSGTNGPTSTDSGMMIAIQKQNFLNSATAQPGQIDGLMVYMRQGGPNSSAPSDAARSDCATLETAVYGLQKSGFISVQESVCVIVDSNFTQLRGIDIQAAAINSQTGGDVAIGYLVQSVFAPCNIGYLAQEDATQGASSWNYGFWFTRSDGVNTSNVDRNGNYLGQAYLFADGTGIDAAAWTAYTPTVVITGGTATATGKFKHVGKVLFFEMTITCTAAGTFSTATLPSNANSRSMFAGRNMSSGVCWVGWSTAAVNTMSAANTSNTGALANGDILSISGVYEST